MTYNYLIIGQGISGTGFGFTKTGFGTLQLSAANSYTGGTTVQAGKLVVSRLHENNAVSIAGGTLQVQENIPSLPSHPAGNNASVSRPSSLSISNNGAPLGTRVYNGTLEEMQQHFGAQVAPIDRDAGGSRGGNGPVAESCGPGSYGKGLPG